ncbi:MAG: BatA domain-containing protein [Balneolaceae bacterium]
MSWLTLLWAGLLAVGLPLLIHRLKRRGTVRLPISSIALIRSGRDRARRRWTRDRSRLLWIRLAALGSLALALAMIVPGEAPNHLNGSGTELATHSGSESEITPSMSPTESSSRMVVALSAEPDVARLLGTAIRLLGETRSLEWDVAAPDQPQLWSRQRRLEDAGDAQEVWLQSGWPEERGGSDQRLAWIQSGGHLVVALDAESSVVVLNRWLASAGVEVRADPAREGIVLSSEGLNDWLGEDLFGRPVEGVRIHLPEVPPVGIFRGATDDGVLLRSEAGDPLVWRTSLGSGWLTLSAIDWGADRQGWAYHPLFPLLLHGLLARPDTIQDEQAMEMGVDTLTTRMDQRVEPVQPGMESAERSWIWMIRVGLVLLLTESVAGRYLSKRRARTGSN